MSLKALQRQWDRFGREDPLWAVLSVPEKRHGRWDEAEFFATGETEIAEILARARTLGAFPSPRRALDFGCGVGRLTRAMASRFERVEGVDIAPSMLERARRYNLHGERCGFHLNERADLRLFEDASFTFVYASLVLQHVPADLAQGYIREMLRVLARGGLLVFHLPSEPFPEDATGVRRRSFAPGPLPPGAWRARIVAGALELAGAPGTEAAVKVDVTNEGRDPWPALAGANARYQVALGGRFSSLAGERLDVPGARAPLPHDVDPGETVQVFLRVTLPQWPGSYRLDVDLVQEDVAWFEERSGRGALFVHCVVPGEPRGVAPRLLTAPAFRQRHPRANALLKRFRPLVALVHAARRGRAAVSWHALMLRHNAAEAWRRLVDPPMQMNGVPRGEVERLIEDAGGRLLEAERSELLTAGWQAYRYWVRRER